MRVSFGRMSSSEDDYEEPPLIATPSSSFIDRSHLSFFVEHPQHLIYFLFNGGPDYWRLAFGQHAGKTITWIAKNDYKYIKFLNDINMKYIPRDGFLFSPLSPIRNQNLGWWSDAPGFDETKED